MNIYKVGFMSEWKTNKLSEVAKVVTGKTPSTSNSAYFGGNIPFVSPADLNEGVLQETKTYLTELGAEQVYLVPKDTVLVSCIGNLGKLAITNQEVCFNQQINGLIFDQTKIYPKYGFYAAQTFKPQLEKASSSTTLPIVNKSRFSEILISYPPLSEQKRIADILDKADELRQKRQQSIEKLDELLQATFIDMFGDPVTNPKGWKVKKLADLGSIATGNTPPRANPENYGNFMEWIKSDNLNHSFDYATKATEYLSEIGAKKARVVPSGTILVTCIAGSFDCIGNLAIVDREVAFNQQINSLTPNDENDTLFLYYLLKISKHIIQSSSTKSMKGMISKSKFSEITLPIPPFEEQIKFSKVFENFNSLKKTALSQLEHQENLFQSLQQRAFKGEL
ncbi:hypothetical protein A9Z64_05745 [Moraxella osloensis]|uniref:Type I restriction enzyme specificity protein MPN_089 n=2 Tax=Faucicola osloensis TaxID=34062 RepID=A0A378QWC7_FAUOS|nr:hypothetical protein A9Z64_05745 [Moraxella osloensis]STZ04951.1 Type I restriction enzyme specificity protein MPN_089 [Moraxella osloensis]